MTISYLWVRAGVFYEEAELFKLEDRVIPDSEELPLPAKECHQLVGFSGSEDQVLFTITIEHLS
jgi:hypothetical protein